MKRCKAKHEHLGVTLRCEAQAGHDCAHYHDGTWWENKHGLPQPNLRSKENLVLAIVWLIAAATVAAAIIYAVSAP